MVYKIWKVLKHKVYTKWHLHYANYVERMFIFINKRKKLLYNNLHSITDTSIWLHDFKVLLYQHFSKKFLCLVPVSKIKITLAYRKGTQSECLNNGRFSDSHIKDGALHSRNRSSIIRSPITFLKRWRRFCIM